METVTVTQKQLRRALSTDFPGRHGDWAAMLIDGLGHRAAHRALKDPRFVAATAAGNARMAGVYFHQAAREVVAALPAKSVPQGWRVTAEEQLPPGSPRGSSRIDVLIRGPQGKRIEVDWKRSVRAGVTTKAQQQMTRHRRHVLGEPGARSLVRQEAPIWTKYVVAVEAEKRAARQRELRRRAAREAHAAHAAAARPVGPRRTP